MGTLADYFRQQGVAKGLEQGLEQGLEHGRQRALALVRKQIQLKFGALNAEFVEQLERASVDALFEMAERTLSAQSIEDVFQTQ